VVTNIEFDHPDFYSSLDDVVETFSQFVRSLPEDGHLVICADDPRCSLVAAEAPCPVTTYGIGSGDLRADPVSPSGYVLFEDDQRRGEVELGVYGRHNVLNSLAAAAVARWLGHGAFEAASTLRNFGGVRRRFQLKGEQAEIRVVDDYAHHPTELSATLAAARATMPGDGRVIAVFQPHRYSRTRALYREFGASFSSADAVLITEVYGAGEMPQPGVNGKLIVDAICETRGHPEVYYIPQQDVIPAVLQSVSRRGDLVLTLGAGDISKAGEDLLGILEERGSKP
jgi:UDP-N-acetylmuramate--alanine ligase